MSTKNKEKVSITVDPDILKAVTKMKDDSRFRSISHAFEYAAKKMIEAGS